MKFQVPQFIETQTKLIGPFTLIQFLWIAGGAVTIFLLNFILTGTWFIISAVVVGGIAGAFAYAKPEGMTLLSYLTNAISFAIGSKKYLFTEKKEEGADISEYTNIEQKKDGESY